MSNSQRRTAFQHRKKQHPGPHDGTSSYETAAFQMGRRIRRIGATVRIAKEQKRHEDNAARPIPTSGPGRRRAKAHRNRGLCLHPGGGAGRCMERAVADYRCEGHQPVVEVEVELTD